MKKHLFLLCLLIIRCDIYAPKAKRVESRYIVVMLDQSLSTPAGEDSLNKATIGRIIHKMLPGDRLSVFAISASGFSNPTILFEAEAPTKFAAHSSTFLRAREAIEDRWKQRSDSLQPKSKNTDITGAFAYLSQLLAYKTDKKMIIVLSDMRQSSKELDIEKMRSVDAEKVLEGLWKSGNMPDLGGMLVACLNVHTRGKGMTAQYYQSLQVFWRRYFEKANAVLVSFQPGDNLDWF